MSKKIILSAFADEYSPDPKLHAAFLEKEGVGYIEPRFVNGVNVVDLKDDELAEYKRILDAHGIRASALGSPLGKINLSDDFAAHLEKAKRAFNAANVLGADKVRMFSFYLDGRTREDARPEVLEKLTALLDLADAYGLTLCHENEAKIYGESHEMCRDLITALPRLKATFDMGNFVLDGCRPYPDAYNLLRDDIAYFHIKDSLSAGAIVPAGKGEAQIKEILTAHAAYSPTPFFISLEPHLETFSGLNKLVGKTFENPYKFDSPEAAFEYALNALKEIIAEVE